LREYALGKRGPLPEPLTCLFPASVFAGVAGKDILCLASGGGQQSAAFSLLGGRVTVVDLSAGQLEGDRKAAAHYGYEVVTIQSDMRDLSRLDNATFDLVYQANSIAYIPDVRQVYSQVARVLRPHGAYRVVFGNPAASYMEWNGQAYCVAKPYAEKKHRRDDGGIEFRHYMDDIFNGLLDSGFSIQRVHEAPYYRKEAQEAEPGSWTHEQIYVAGEFAIVATKNG
jgi:SAM-dependent methyltransferase